MAGYLLIPLMLILAMTAEGAAVYKWVDDKGVTHYSQTPPPDKKAKEVELPPPPSKEAVEQAQQRLKALMEEQNKQEEAQKEKQIRKQQVQGVKEEEERLNRCLAAQARFDLLQYERPVFRMEKGQPVYLEDKDRPAEMERLKKEIAVCLTSKGDKEKFQAARTERFWHEACSFFANVLRNAENPEFNAMTATEIMNLKEVNKSYCSETWRGRGERVHRGVVTQNACKVLQDLSAYLMSQHFVSDSAVSFSAMVETQCRR